MNVTEEQIWAYLAGELDEDTSKIVADALQADEGLQQIANDYRRLLAGFQEQRIKKYAAEAMEVMSEAEGRTTKQAPAPTVDNSKRVWLWIAAAAATVLLLIGLFTFPFFQPVSNQEVATTYFRLPADPSVAGSGTANNFYDGLDAFFAQKDYAQAITYWEPITQDSVFGLSAAYYLGHAYFLDGAYDKAQQQLETTLRTNNQLSPQEIQDLEWNILLARMAKGENIQSELEGLPSSPERDALLKQLREAAE